MSLSEIWKDIKGYEGCYQISSFGRVKSLSRLVDNGNGGFIMKERILKHFCDKDGYFCIKFQVNNVRNHFKVHRLVAEAFVCNLENKPQVNHDNGVKSCNFDWNLIWATNGENQKHSYDNFNRQGITKKKKVFQYIDGIQIKEFKSLSEASRELNVNISAISRCCSGQRTKIKGFTFKLK